MKKSQLQQIIREEIGKVLKESTLGMSLKTLPSKVKHALSYEYDSSYPEYKLAISLLEKWIKNNLSQLEDGKSASFISNKGKDFEKIASMLETTPETIIDYIDTQTDEILGY